MCLIKSSDVTSPEHPVVLKTLKKLFFTEAVTIIWSIIILSVGVDFYEIK